MRPKSNNRNKIFVERGVEVMFDHEWTVIKLDEHRYYKRVSGHGISGVDFMAVHQDLGLVLIEMKNYIKGYDSIPGDIDEKMMEKRKDTLRLIKIVNTYFRRQWYFRFLTWMDVSYFYPREWYIWMLAEKHVENENYLFIGVIDY